MKINDFVKNILYQYGIRQTERHIHYVCQFLRENNPKDSKWSKDNDLRLPTREEILCYFSYPIKPNQEVLLEIKPRPISFIYQNTGNSKDTIYDKILSYFDPADEIEGDIQELFLNGALFRNVQSERYLLIPSMLKLNESSFGTQIETYSTLNTKSFVYINPREMYIKKTSDLEKAISEAWALIQSPVQDAITNLVLKSGLVDNDDIAKATGKAGIVLADRLLQALQGRIQLGEAKPVRVENDEPWDHDVERRADTKTAVNFSNSDLGLSFNIGQDQISSSFSPKFSVQMILGLNNTRTLVIEVTAENFVHLAAHSNPINIESSFSFPILGIYVRFF